LFITGILSVLQLKLESKIRIKNGTTKYSNWFSVHYRKLEQTEHIFNLHKIKTRKQYSRVEIYLHKNV